jgi:hypothetical protein
MILYKICSYIVREGMHKPARGETDALYEESLGFGFM